MSADRRQHERFELLAHVALSHGGGHVDSFPTINISAGGILLRNDRNVRLAMNEAIRITFDVPDLTPTFAIDARIVRVVEATAKPGLLAAMWTSRDTAASYGLEQILWNLRKP